METKVERCANCEYWYERYRQCEHPEQEQKQTLPNGAPPDMRCELWEADA